MKAQAINTLKKLWNDESGQGSAEYILLLVVVVGIVMVFKDSILNTVNQKLEALNGDIMGVTSR